MRQRFSRAGNGSPLHDRRRGRAQLAGSIGQSGGGQARKIFIALNAKSPRLVPLHRDSTEQSLFHRRILRLRCGRMDMAVNGKWVMRGTAFYTMDCDAVRKSAQEASEYLVSTPNGKRDAIAFPIFFYTQQKRSENKHE
jgi:hypothetical protein